MRPKRISIQGILVLASLGFILPFVTVSCQGVKLVSLSGAQLATGTKVDGGGLFQATIVPPNPYIIAAFILGLVAFLIGFAARKKAAQWIAAALSVFATANLLLFSIDAPSRIRQATAQALTLEMELGFWVSIICYALATLIGLAEVIEIPTEGGMHLAVIEPLPLAAGAGGLNRFCASCGSPTLPGKPFCAACGARLISGPEPINPGAVPAAAIPPPTPREPLTLNQRLTVWGASTGIALLIACCVGYEYYSAQPVRVVVQSNLVSERIFLDGVEITNAPGTQRSGVDADSMTDWNFTTTRGSHSLSIQSPNAPTWNGRLAPSPFTKLKVIKAFLNPQLETVIYRTNPPGSEVSHGHAWFTTGSNGTVQTSEVAGTYVVHVKKDGYPSIDETITVVHGEPNLFSFDLEALRQQQRAASAQQALDHLNQANVLFQQQQYDAALAECQAASQLDPANPDVARLKQQITQTKSILGVH